MVRVGWVYAHHHDVVDAGNVVFAFCWRDPLPSCSVQSIQPILMVHAGPCFVHPPRSDPHLIIPGIDATNQGGGRPGRTPMIIQFSACDIELKQALLLICDIEVFENIGLPRGCLYLPVVKDHVASTKRNAIRNIVQLKELKIGIEQLNRLIISDS